MIAETRQLGFPLPGELLEFIPAEQTRKDCNLCDSGWIPAGKDSAGNYQVRRCECKLTGKRQEHE